MVTELVEVLDGESRFRASDFNHGEEKILSVTLRPDFRRGVF